MSTTRLELLISCVLLAAKEAEEKLQLDGWVLTIRSRERAITIDIYRQGSEDEQTLTFPTAGWGGTIDEILKRIENETH